MTSLITKATVIFLLFLFAVSAAFAQTGETYFEAGNKKYNLGDYKGALLDYNKAIELNPKDADYYFNAGVAKILWGQKDSGCMDLSKAGEMGVFKAYYVIKKFCN